MAYTYDDSAGERYKTGRDGGCPPLAGLQKGVRGGVVFTPCGGDGIQTPSFLDQTINSLVRLCDLAGVPLRGA